MTDQPQSSTIVAAAVHPASSLHPLRLIRWSGQPAALLLSAFLATMLFALLGAHGFDDPFITYRYARNLAQGHGFVYNPGVRLLSTTTPLFAVLLVPAAWLGWSLPVVSNLIGCLSVALTGWALWLLGQHWHTPAAGWTALVLYPLFPLLTSTLGGETLLYHAWIVWAVVAWDAQRRGWAACLLALAALTRPDGVLLAALLGVLDLWQQRRIAWRAWIIYAMIGLAWCGWAFSYFGSPVPVTLATKQAQATMLISRTFRADLLSVIATQGQHPLYRLQVASALLGVGLLVGAARRWAVLPAWAMIYTGAYALLGVSSYFWYYAPLALGWIILVAVGVEALRRFVQRWLGSRATALALTSVIVLLGLPQLFGLRYVVRHPDPRLHIYRQAGEWLSTNTPADANVATLEVGILGYYSQRPMIDFAGLIQPTTATRLTPTTTYEDAALWAVDQFQPDYLVLPRGVLPRVEHEALAQDCGLSQTFTAPDALWPLDVYECKVER